MLYWTLSIALGVFDIRIFSCLPVFRWIFVTLNVV